MNISVRVLSANAQAQIKALQMQVAKLEGQLATANATAASPRGLGSARSRKSLQSWGNQVQWTGRQLQYNWTLPLAVAGFAATKFAMDNEKAFTRVKKVYGDTDAAVRFFRENQEKIPEGMNAVTAAAAAEKNELEALGKAFEALSTRYSVAQQEVLETAGAWAAAGSSGKALAESTQLSIKAAILGDMELAKATEALIAIQSQYSLSTEELGLTLAQLNAIENQTGIQMKGLVEGFTRAAGVAREAGIDVRHLGAMLAALVPATGSASTAGNALKTIISRLMAPTKDSADVMKEFGVDTSTAMWNSSTAMERLMVLAGHMGTSLKKAGKDSYVLSSSQKNVVASVLGSRYQMNRFLVLMRELGPETTYYEKALKATSNRSKVFAQATKELNAVLESNPKRLEIIWRTIQNGMATAIQPLIPYIIYLAQSVANAVTWFSNLDPAVQKLALMMFVLLAAVGPVVKYFGSLMTLIGTLIMPFKFFIAQWVAFATVTKIVDGQAVTTRRSLIGMMIAMVAWPFRKVASGFGLIVGALGLVQAKLGATAASFFVFNKTIAVSAATSQLPSVFASMWGLITKIFKAGGAATLGVQSAFNAASVASTVAGEKAKSAAVARYETGRTVQKVAANAKFSAADAAMYNYVLNLARGFFVARRGIEAAGAGSSLSIHTGYALKHSQVDQMLYAYLLQLQRGYIAAKLGLEAGASTRRLAIESGTNAAVVAGTVATNTAVVTTHATAATATVGIWVKARRGITAAIIGLPKAFAAFGKMLVPLLLNPWILVGALIIGVIYKFRNEIAQIWGNLVEYFSSSTEQMSQMVLRAWNALPQGVANALTAVIRIVQQAAQAIAGWFSYINPFARHSPSLVDNVTRGMKVVGDQFGKASGAISRHVKGAQGEIRAFNRAIKGLTGGAASFEQAQERAKIKKFAPGALNEYNALSRRLKVLNNDLAVMEGRVSKQQAVVDRWTAAVERANNALDKQQDKLDKLTAIQNKWQEKLDEAQDRLDDFASAPIKGMGAMSDAIFENDMAQKRLRLEMMKMEEVTGPLEDIKSKIEAINGAQEMLRGEQAALRSAGAGSEILSHYDDQIAALEATKEQQNDAAEAIQNMSDQLEELQHQGEMLDLENSLKFDPLIRQIEEAANAMEELPFDKIMAGVQDAAADVEKYQEKLDNATAAVDKQQDVVDKMTAARDKLQDRLDRESDKLSKLEGKYDEVSQAIGDVESVMNSAAGAADDMANKVDKAAKKLKKLKKFGDDIASVSPAVQNFRDAAGGDFAQVGGAGIPIRTDWSDQTKQIEDFTKQLADEAANAFSDINPFDAVKRKWNDFVAWLRKVWGPVKDMFSEAFAGIGGSANFTKTVDSFRIAWAKTKDWFSDEVIAPIKKLWELFGPDVMRVVNGIVEGFKHAWKTLGPELAGIVKELAEFGPALKGIWNIAKVALAIFALKLLPILKLIASVVSNLVGPAFKTTIDILKGVIRVIRGVIQFVSGFFALFSGDFEGGFKKMAAGIGNIFGGLVDIIWANLKGLVKTVIGVFKGLAIGAWEWIKWLYDVLFGHSIIPDIIDAFFFYFKLLAKVVILVWNIFARPIFALFKTLFTGVISAFRLWWVGITVALAVFKTLATWFWKYVLKPVWNKVSDFWKDYIKPAFSMWWAGIKAAWKALTKAADWIWDKVLEPVWDNVKEVWKKYIKPGLKAWWAGFKNQWDALKKAASWIWDKVLKPVWNEIKDLWNKNVRPELREWWGRVKAAWDALKKAGVWFWDHVLKPVWERVKKLWNDNVRPELRAWWGRIKNAWNALTGLGRWVENNVMDPVFNKIKNGWEAVRDWLVNNKNMLTGPVRGIVNTVISAVNKIISGLNKVSDVLPGVKWHIDPIRKLAAGGEAPRRQANRGFKTTGARAIVGEGKANYPEFVIPTDPTYRNRAKSLLAMAAAKVGVTAGVDLRGAMGDTLKDVALVARANPTAAAGAIPEFGLGGWISDNFGKATDSLKKQLAKLGKNAIGKVIKPILSAADGTINRVGYPPVEAPPRYVISKIRTWVEDSDANLNNIVGKAKDDTSGAGGPAIRAALAFARSQVGDPYVWGGVGPNGYDCSGFMSAITNHIRGKNPYSRLGSTATFPWGGFKPGAKKNGFTIGSTSSYSGGVGHMAGTLGGVNVESAGGVGVRVGASARGYNDSGFNEVYHLYKGGIAKARRGGVLANMAERGYDEAVVPLPRDWRSSLIGSSGDSEKHYHFYGDMSFPNVRTGDDAKTFLDNLDNLAED